MQLMPKMKMTYQALANLETPQKATTYYDQVQKGLELFVTEKGTKSFTYRYRSAGKHRRYTIGRFPDLSLAEAREKVRELKVKVSNGVDPQKEKKSQRNKPKKMTVKELCDIFAERHLPNLKPTTRKEYKRIIDTELLKKHKWGTIPAEDISSQEVRDVLNHKAYEEEAFTMANRIRSTISKLFEFGMKHVGLGIDYNPVNKTPVFKQGENKRNRVYSEAEIKELWEYWETRPEPIQSVYKMLLLTGQRKTETMRMKWDDIETGKPCKKIVIDENNEPKPEAFLANVWHIEENKSNRNHELPLPPKTYRIIENLKPHTGETDYVFASPVLDNEPLKSIKSTSELIQKDTSITDFRPHDLRRTVATNLEEILIEPQVIKRILNHSPDSVTGRHYTWYDYMDKKLEALKRWSLRVANIVSESN